MKRVKGKKKKRYLGKALLAVFLMVGIIWVYRSTWMAKTLEFAVVETGTIAHETTVKATFANREYFVNAPLAGRVEFAGQNGQRFRKGETIALVSAEGVAPGVKGVPAAQPVVAPKGGILYQWLDGLETIITPENMLMMDLAKLLAQPRTQTSYQGTVVQNGQAFGKLVNNLNPTVGFVEIPSLEGLSLGDTLKFTVDGKAQSGKIVRKTEQPRGVVVEFNQYVEGSVENRQREIIWKAKPPVSGPLIPKSALYVQGEELGVYVVSEGVIRFKRVKVIDQNEEQVCVEDLPSGMAVVTNPRSGLEGLPISVKNR